MLCAHHIFGNYFNTIFQMVVLLGMVDVVTGQSSQNLLVNGDFSMTNLSGHSYQYFPGKIVGWNCTTFCEVDDCVLLNNYWISMGSYNANCTGKILDLIGNTPQNVTQNIQLTAGKYLLSLNYYYPRFNAKVKTFQIFFNEVIIFSFTPNVSTLYEMFYFEKEVEGVEGQNVLRLTTIRSSGGDTFGFTVNNLQLVQLTGSNIWTQNMATVGKIAKTLTRIPGSRIFLGDIMSFFINFDRLQFYYYHDRNYSIFSDILLAEINIINNLKGTILIDFYQLFQADVDSMISNYFTSLDYKYNYTTNATLLKNSNGRGFVSNCYNFFVYNMGGAFLLYLVLLGSFWAWRQRPCSRLLRKYFFLGLLMSIICQGNIESLTYYAIGEFLLLFSANFKHKLINVFIIFFQFFIIAMSVGSILLFKWHYRKKIGYFLENKRRDLMGIWCQTIEYGIVCIIFGIAHQTLYYKPNLQLAVLFAIEAIWMATKAFHIVTRVYRQVATEWVMFISGFLRMSFILTFYFYQKEQLSREMINENIHKVLLIILLLLWGKEFTISMIHLFHSLLKLRKKIVIDSLLIKACEPDVIEIINNEMVQTKNNNEIKITQIEYEIVPKQIPSLVRRCPLVHVSRLNKNVSLEMYNQRIARIVRFQLAQ